MSPTPPTNPPPTHTHTTLPFWPHPVLDVSLSLTCLRGSYHSPGLGLAARPCASLWILILFSLSTPLSFCLSPPPPSPPPPPHWPHLICSRFLNLLSYWLDLFYFDLNLTKQNQNPTLNRYCSAINRNKWLIHTITDGCQGHYAESGGGEANCKRLYTIVFHFYKILKMAKLRR